MNSRIANNIPAEGARRLTEAAARFPEVDVLYIFGSRASGKARSSSDIDIAVLVNEKTQRDSYFDLRRRLVVPFCEAMKNDAIDVVILNEAPLHLAFEAVEPRNILYERDPAHRIEFEVRVISEFFDFRPLLEVRKRYVKQQLAEDQYFG